MYVYVREVLLEFRIFLVYKKMRKATMQTLLEQFHDKLRVEVKVSNVGSQPHNIIFPSKAHWREGDGIFRTIVHRVN